MSGGSRGTGLGLSILVLAALLLVGPSRVRAADLQPALFAVDLNGEPLEEGLFCYRDGEGDLVIRERDLRRWRFVLPVGEPLQVEGEPWWPLSAFPNVEVEIDPRRLHVSLTAPAERFEPTVIGTRRRQRVRPSTARSAALTYRLAAQGGDGGATALRGLFEMRVADPSRWGRLEGTLRYDSLENEWERLGTTWRWDFVERRRCLTVGDSATVAGGLGTSFRFAGVRWGTDFRLDPWLLVSPQLSVLDRVDRSSVVEIFVDNARRLRLEVPPGPFEIRDIPTVSSHGDARIVITDSLGRERVIFRPFLLTGRLLEAGLTEESYALGFERFRARGGYDRRLFGSSTYRRGLSSRWTVEGRADVREDLQMVAAGATWGISQLGTVVELTVGVSRSDVGAGEEGVEVARGGARLGIGLDRSSGRFAFGLRSEWTDAGFRQLGRDRGAGPARVDQARVSFDLGRLGAVGLSLLRRRGLGSASEIPMIPELRAIPEEPEDPEMTGGLDGLDGLDDLDDLDGLELGSAETVVSLQHSVRLGPGDLTIQGLATLEPRRSARVLLSYVMRLGRRRQLTVTSSREPGGQESRAVFERHRDRRQTGWAYRVEAEGLRESPGSAPGSATAVRARVSHAGRRALAALDVSHRDGRTAARAELGGSLLAVQGNLAWSRPAGASFGVVEVPGFPGVEIFQDRQPVGHTDRRGRLVLPFLSPFRSNVVEIGDGQLPLQAELESLRQEPVPHAGSGVRVLFDARIERNVRFRLVGEDGEPLPAGTRLFVVDSAAGTPGASASQATPAARVGRDGKVFLAGVAEPVDLSAARARSAGEPCLLHIEPPVLDAEHILQADPVEDLGTVVCSGEGPPPAR